ncbi:hypothetical protein A9762_20850 [Pandoraea sp. ISTKB]|nr:hypothetical protein A9762_20850 [Pandoraea sp. ISTKB]
MTFATYDPIQQRPTGPTNVGKYVVRGARRPGMPLPIYTISLNGEIVGTQVSQPSKSDCDAALKRHRALNAVHAAKQAAIKSKAAASDAKARATRAKRKAANSGTAQEAA